MYSVMEWCFMYMVQLYNLFFLKCKCDICHIYHVYLGTFVLLCTLVPIMFLTVIYILNDNTTTIVSVVFLGYVGH